MEDELLKALASLEMPSEISEAQALGMGMERTAGIWHHPKDRCAGEHCPFHNPSQHAMAEEPMVLRRSGLIERRCPHGIGHPDPDSLAFFIRMYDERGDRENGEALAVHGCDGCCSKLGPSAITEAVRLARGGDAPPAPPQVFG